MPPLPPRLSVFLFFFCFSSDDVRSAQKKVPECVNVCVCMRVCVCLWMTYVNMFACLHVFVCVCVSLCEMCVCVCLLYQCICMCARVCACVHVFAFGLLCVV